MRSSVIELPPKMETLYSLFKLNIDVAIEDIYDVMILNDDGEKVRYEKQRAIGPKITRLNRLLEAKKEKITPGLIKGTYRLVKI